MVPKSELKSLRNELEKLKATIAGLTPVMADLQTTARRYGFSVSTLRYLATSGKLTGIAFRSAGKWRVDQKAFEQGVRDGRF